MRADVTFAVFPLAARGKGAGIATAANWMSNFIVAMVFPVAIGSQEGREQQRKVGYCFLAFAVICLLSIGYVYELVPETRNKSLEEIEESFEAHRLHRKRRRFAALRKRVAAEAPGPSGPPVQPAAM
jgi:hypothetical protein